MVRLTRRYKVFLLFSFYFLEHKWLGLISQHYEMKDLHQMMDLHQMKDLNHDYIKNLIYLLQSLLPLE
jgi:hypothetical protein